MKRRREGGKNGGREWKEMGRLAREVGWAIEERRGMEEGRGGDGEMITLYGMKKNLAAEKRKREEEKKKSEEETRRAEHEKKTLEETIRSLKQEVEELKYRPVISLDGTSVTFTPLEGAIKIYQNPVVNSLILDLPSIGLVS